MGDPFSTAAAILGVAATCTKVATRLWPYFEEASEVDDVVRDFHRQIESLKATVTQVEYLFQPKLKEVEADDTEKRLREHIGRSLQSCLSTLEKLGKKLPDSQQDGRNFLRRIPDQLRMTIRERAISILRADVLLNTQMLQLDLKSFTM